MNWKLGTRKFKLAMLLNRYSLPFLPLSSPEDVQALVSGKLALRYAGRQVEKLNPFYLPIISENIVLLCQIFSYQNILHF